MSTMYYVAQAVLVSIIGTFGRQENCAGTLSSTKCHITWMANFRVQSVDKMYGDQYESSSYTLQVLNPIMGVREGEVIRKSSRAPNQGGLQLETGEEYVLSGINEEFTYCTQLLGQERDYSKISEEKKRELQNINRDCGREQAQKTTSTASLDPTVQLSDRDLLLMILEIVKKLESKLLNKESQ
ncbi:hypothetical protein AB6A40_010980 [Gnathostoma spinigerum]|uniref:Uncharacterized protein n=1 Tax=Gnathostoma spinigerum TaxID=75299 RepID=A0ABD6EY52_9BILA